MLAKDLMTSGVFSVNENKDFNHVELVAELKNVRHIPVVDESGHLTGIVSIRDLLAHLTVGGASHFVPIKEVMHKEVVSVSPDTSIKEVAELLIKKNIGCVPVVEDGLLKGIISERDFLRLAK